MTWFIYICAAAVIAIIIVVLTITLIPQKENYKLMKNLGKFPKNIGIINFSGHPVEDEYDSLKYRNHRYERQKVRYHAPNKIYQQTQA